MLVEADIFWLQSYFLLRWLEQPCRRGLVAGALTPSSPTAFTFGLFFVALDPPDGSDISDFPNRAIQARWVPGVVCLVQKTYRVRHVRQPDLVLLCLTLSLCDSDLSKPIACYPATLDCRDRAHEYDRDLYHGLFC